MSGFQFGLSIVMVVASLFLIVTILLQQGKQQGLGSIDGGADTFFGANKARGLDAILKKMTAVVACLFIVVSLIMNLV